MDLNLKNLSLIMFPVEITEKNATIYFNPDFYYMYTISKICEKFQDLAKFLIVFMKDENKIKVVISPKIETDLKNFTLDFCNHVLHEQIKLSK